MTPTTVLSLIVTLITELPQLEAELQTVIGVAKTQIAGEPVTVEQIASLEAVQTTIDAQITAAEAALPAGA